MMKWSLVCVCALLGYVSGVEYLLGGLNPTTLDDGSADRDGQSAYLAVLAAIDDINSDESFEFTFSLQNNDTKNTPDTAVAIANYLNGLNVIGFVGPQTSSEAIRVVPEVSVPNQIPTLTGTVTASTLTSNALYPYFLRTCPPADPQADAIVALITKFSDGVEGVSIITSIGNDAASALADGIIEKSGNGYYVAREYFVDEYAADATIRHTLDLIRDTGDNIIVLSLYYNELTARFFKQAYLMDMVDGYQWITDDSTVSLYSYHINGQINSDAVAGAVGSVAFAPIPGLGNSYVQFLGSYANAYNKYASTGWPRAPVPLAAYHYDAVYVFANGVKNLLANGGSPSDGAALLSALRGVSFTGVTGDVSFTTGSNDRGAVTFGLYTSTRSAVRDLQGSYLFPDLSIDSDFEWRAPAAMLVPSLMMAVIVVLFVLGM